MKSVHCQNTLVPISVLLFVIAFTLHAENDAATPGASQPLLPLNDNTAPPYMGLYEGVPPAGITQVDEYAKWLHRTLVWGHGSVGCETWNSIEKPHWLLVPWGKWVDAMAGRRVVLSIPLLAAPVAKGAPPFTLKEGATGAYDNHFAALAQMLVDHHMGNSIIRLGWEFDGGWYYWKTLDRENAAYYAKCFHEVVTAMRAVPGAEKLAFCWNGAGENVKYDLQDAYPGDDVVDYIGLDIYDKTWVKGIYPYPPNASPEQKLDSQQKAWQTLYTNKHGIKAWIDFAKLHQKPFMIPEWGLWRSKDGHGGEDDPYFVQQMYNLIQDPANNVYEAAYWDSREAKVIPTGGTASQYPVSAALFRKLFSLTDAGAGAPVSSSAPSGAAQ